MNTSEAGVHFILLFIESEQDLKKGLEAHLQKHLPDYMIPKEIITVSLFPLNSNGKIDRKALINTYLQMPLQGELSLRNNLSLLPTLEDSGLRDKEIR